MWLGLGALGATTTAFNLSNRHSETHIHFHGPTTIIQNQGPGNIAPSDIHTGGNTTTMPPNNHQAANSPLEGPQQQKPRTYAEAAAYNPKENKLDETKN